MVRINLLPLKHQKKKKINYILVYFIIWGIIVLSEIGYLYYIKTQEIKIRNEITELKKKIRKQYKIISKLDKIKKEDQLIEEKIKVIAKIKKERSYLIKLIDATITKFPSHKMFLIKYEINFHDTKMEGIALNLPTVAQYMKYLERTKRFSNIYLKEIKRVNIKNYDLVNFSLILKNKR